MRSPSSGARCNNRTKESGFVMGRIRTLAQLKLTVTRALQFLRNAMLHKARAS
jgi:hypothetical protein